MLLPADMTGEPHNRESEVAEPITLGGRIGIFLLLFFVLTIMTIGLGKFIALMLR